MNILLLSSAKMFRVSLHAATLLALCNFSTAFVQAQESAGSAGDFYSPQMTFVPRNPDGVMSDYSGTQPSFEKNDSAEVLKLANSGNEANLQWTFYRHKQPAAAQWPAGAGARAVVTLTSAEDAVLQAQIFVGTSESNAGEKIPSVHLMAGQPATIEFALPETLAEGPIETLRVQLTGSKKIPSLTVTDWSVGRRVFIALHPPADDVLRLQNPFAVKGRAAAGSSVEIRAVGEGGVVAKEWSVTADDGGLFELPLDRAHLPAGPLHLEAEVKGSEAKSARETVYIYPLLSEMKPLPLVARHGRDLIVDGKRWAFLGINYTRFLLEISLRSNYRDIAEELRTYGKWGLTVVRVPLHLGMIQPREGVYPDSPDYQKILESHHLNTGFFEELEYFIAVAGHYGIRVSIDWHEMPVDPYRYFVGGNLSDKKEGKPGQGIAWLHDQASGKAAEPGDPRLTKVIVNTNRWMTRHFKGNGNILCIEVPYNEPHSAGDSADLAWRHLTAAVTLPIVTEDPERLTFGMPPAWGHSNVLPSATWMLPDLISGMAPHDYLGNGPVDLRSDAKTRKEPWLARDVEATFDYSFAAVALPYSAVTYPIWNGESGEHGYQSLLPEMSHQEASSLMIEAQIVQAYAAGWMGSLGWTLTGNAQVYDPVGDLYASIYTRFSPVYAAGPLDRGRAEVLFVQNPAAVPIGNGLNYACVPFAKLALDLHLGPVHYMTDDQLLSVGLVQMAVGLEQVEQVAVGLSYKAVVVDTRNLDQRVLDLIRGSKIPLLVVKDASKLTTGELSAFLAKAGVALDQKTPAELQLIEGPGHLLVYRRSGEGAAKVYPHLKLEGSFRLIDESGQAVFSGAGDALTQQGLPVDLPKWRTAIFKIEKL